MDDRLPRGLRRLLDRLTVEDKYRKFRIGNSREPQDDDEVEEFVQELARSLHAAGAVRRQAAGYQIAG